jgi:orsellinic acid C2-O-methyltransferase
MHSLERERAGLMSPVDSTSDRARLLALINASWTTQVAATAVELGLADLLAQGVSSLATLAAASGCHAPSLQRLLRALVSLDLCVENQDGTFELTSTGMLLREDIPESLAAWATVCGRQSWLIWHDLAESVRTGKSVRLRTLGVDGFAHLDSDRRKARRFNRAMVNLTQPIAAAIARLIDFSADRGFVDVGGGFGGLAAAILAIHPSLQGVVYDLEHATVDAPAVLAHAGVSDRCQVLTGSFFDGVPPGADTYLLKSILHNWDDERCVNILRQCRRAMPAHARLIVIERIAPERPVASPDDQAIARSDLNMLVSCAGQERTLKAYEALLAAGGLHPKRLYTVDAGYSAIEAG